jgi:hypothetical protein
MSSLPALPSIDIITERLPLIIPEGIPNRNYCIRGMAVSTVFSMIYIGAVEDTGILFSPKHVYRMTAEQAEKITDNERKEYYNSILKRKTIQGKRWYQDNTREPIRDETLKEGLVAIGVVTVDQNVPTTSGKGRYALKKNFYKLFDPFLSGDELTAAIIKWQEENLSRNALARVQILKGGGDAENKILVTLPNKETRFLQQGPSSVIAKAVIEIFATKFLSKPFLLWLSESGNKVVEKDDALATRLGINIDVSKHLPDIIMVDLGDEKKLSFIFIEVVATDGPLTASRQEAFFRLTDKAGYKRTQVLFVTAYLDRQSPAFKKTIPELAWNSFAWFVSEPDNIFILKEGVIKLNEL